MRLRNGPPLSYQYPEWPEALRLLRVASGARDRNVTHVAVRHGAPRKSGFRHAFENAARGFHQ